jgi:molecular chaperone GrpE (heat shock protein)
MFELSLRGQVDWGWETVTKLSDAPEQEDVATLQAQIADLKRTVARLQAELAHMREQRDKWQSKAERVSIVAPC